VLNHYRAQLARGAFGAVVLISFAVLFTPESGVPAAPPGTDKVVHFALFAALAGTGLGARIRRVPLAAGLVCYAALSEVLQGVLPLGRSGDVLDALVDVAGIAAGFAVVAAAARSALARQRG